ncbi:(2Fe-2S)-binding protein [Myxococcota bacterium]|nr:(2Fe-2S)-binding protein [Myxococcota bacterium]
MSSTADLDLVVNGERVTAPARPGDTLLDVLRGPLGLTGAKAGCREGECGACTVLLDGLAVNACLTLAWTCAGREVVTVEGLSRDGVLSPVQRAFVDAWAVQCGFCTPGMVLQATALLARNPDPTPEEARRGIEGNLCRCTGYGRIVEAIRAAAAAGRANP